MDGFFVTFEGPEGSGKTTQLRLLSEWVRAQGHPPVVTREPGGTHIGEDIRGILHDCEHVEMSAHAEILLYSASRAQLVAQVIRPALAAGHVVLCDRYFDSTYAYQGYGRGLSLAALRSITEFAVQGLKPDLTLYLDVPVDMGLRRREQSGEAMNRLDREAVAFHKRVRAGYLELAAAEPDRWRVIDATGPVEAVQTRLRVLVQTALDGRRNAG